MIDACLNATVCKNLFLCNRQKTNFYLLMMPGDKPFKTKELSHQLGIARLSFASPEDMEQYLDCTPGSSSIMGLANDTENKVQLLMDEDVKKGEYLGCHPCINTSSLKLRTADVLEISDFIGSTSEILDYATKSDAKEFIICTEMGIFFELEQKNPDKRFYSGGHRQFCPNMKKITLEKVVRAMEEMEPEVTMDEELRVKANAPLVKMLELAK